MRFRERGVEKGWLWGDRGTRGDKGGRCQRRGISIVLYSISNQNVIHNICFTVAFCNPFGLLTFNSFTNSLKLYPRIIYLWLCAPSNFPLNGDIKFIFCN